MSWSCFRVAKAGKKKKKKRVRFDDDILVAYFEPYHDDGGENWERVALDRTRFERRISTIDQSIGWIFSTSHRQTIAKIINVNNCN